MRRERLTITLSKNILSSIDAMVDGKNIRNRSHAIESILSENIKPQSLKQAVILGGGKGIRLKNETTSKLMLPLENGKTLIESNIETLKRAGVTNFILSLGDYGDQVRKTIKDGSKYGVKVIYFERDKGTADVLKKSKDLIENTFIMMNGDILLKDVDLLDLYNYHKNNKGLATMAVTSESDPSVLGLTKMKGTEITEFEEKPELKDETPAGLINAGIYIFEPDICNMVRSVPSSLERDIFPELAKKRQLKGYPLNGKWVHLDDEESYKGYLESIKK